MSGAGRFSIIEASSWAAISALLQRDSNQLDVRGADPAKPLLTENGAYAHGRIARALELEARAPPRGADRRAGAQSLDGPDEARRARRLGARSAKDRRSRPAFGGSRDASSGGRRRPRGRLATWWAGSSPALLSSQRATAWRPPGRLCIRARSRGFGAILDPAQANSSPECGTRTSDVKDERPARGDRAGAVGRGAAAPSRRSRATPDELRSSRCRSQAQLRSSSRSVSTLAERGAKRRVDRCPAESYQTSSTTLPSRSPLQRVGRAVAGGGSIAARQATATWATFGEDTPKLEFSGRPVCCG